jgi:hypothetical protein
VPGSQGDVEATDRPPPALAVPEPEPQGRPVEPEPGLVEPNPQGDLGAASDADVNGGKDNLDELRVEIARLLEAAGDDLAEQRIRGAGNNLGALRDLHRFATQRAARAAS